MRKTRLLAILGLKGSALQASAQWEGCPGMNTTYTVKHIQKGPTLFIIGIILTCIVAGCSSSEDSSLLKNQDVVYYVAKLNKGVISTNSNVIINRMLSDSNIGDRISSMRLFSDLLLKMDISSLSYADQRRVINEVNESILKISSSLGLSGLSVEEAFCIRIKWLTWQKKQMDRLRPTKRIDISKLSYKQKVVYNEWRACYESLVYSHEMFNRMMEGWSVELELENAPSSIKEEVTRKMEAFLGRKIRTREEAFAAKGELTDSDEMKAIRRGEVGPENIW